MEVALPPCDSPFAARAGKDTREGISVPEQG